MTDTTASLQDDPVLLQRPVTARLRVVFPSELGFVIELVAEPVTLGRRPDDGSPELAHATVSRRHAQLWWDGRGHHVIRDLGSRHGTYLGAVRVDDAPRRLHDGDIVRVGDVFAAYEVVDDDDDGSGDRESIPGASAAAARLRAAVARAAVDPSPALIVGETGTGKEWVARALHRGSRCHGPLIAVNCATLSRELSESQLFGHVRGAFTGATADQDGWFRRADGGTLFLDELGELPLDLQPKLLRVVQDGLVLPLGANRPIAVRVRLIAATNRDLEAAVTAGTFRRDLLARLTKWLLPVPPLTRRRGDLLAWVERLWDAWHSERDRPAPALTWSSAAVAMVLAAPWPDNLRGVDRLVHALASVGRSHVDAADLPGWLRDDGASARADAPAIEAAAAAPAEAPRRPVPTREEFVAAWGELSGSVRAVAKHFGRDRRQIYRWAEAYGLRVVDGSD